MEWYGYLIIALAFFLIFIVVFTGYRIAQGIYHPVRQSLLETRAREMEKTPDLVPVFDAWKKIEYHIETRSGYDLKAYYLPVEHPLKDASKRFVVIAHGYTYTHHGGLKYAYIMKQLGFNVILYDERFHGESGGKNCSLGFYEELDLEDVITDTFLRFGADIYLGTYGESMGGATVILEQAHDDRLRFCIADCAYSDVFQQIGYLIKKKLHLPKWPFLPLANWFFKAATKVGFNQISPIAAVKKAKVPMLFLHGSGDEFVLPCHSQSLFDACGTMKRLYLTPDKARHAEAFRTNREEYTAVVKEFITSILVKE